MTKVLKAWKTESAFKWASTNAQMTNCKRYMFAIATETKRNEPHAGGIVNA